MLEEFYKESLGQYPDLYDLKGSIQRDVEERVKGRKTTVTVGVGNIDRYFKELSSYQKEREDIQTLQRAIRDDYEKLKRTYQYISKNPMQQSTQNRQSLSYMQDPEKAELLIADNRRFSDIHIQVMRLFNGYITIYSDSFSAKLKLLEEKYLSTRNLIIDIFRETNALTSVNRDHTVGTGVIPYNPKLNGF